MSEWVGRRREEKKKISWGGHRVYKGKPSAREGLVAMVAGDWVLAHGPE